MDHSTPKHNFVVIGGGIGGVSCVEALCELTSSASVALISASPYVKAATTIHKYGYTLESLDVQNTNTDHLTSNYPNLHVIYGLVKTVDTNAKTIYLQSGDNIHYDKLCIATGGKPKCLSDNPNVLSIRDTESIEQFQKKLRGAARLVVVGNGGIATELVYELRNCEVIWAVKHKSISAAFFDPGAAQFFLPHLNEEPKGESITKRWTYESFNDQIHDKADRGSSLGPDWAHKFSLTGSAVADKQVHVELEVEVKSVLTFLEFASLHYHECTGSTKQWPVYVQLTNGNVYGTDVVVNATGVQPCLNFDIIGTKPQFGEDHGIVVDTEMRTNIKDLYAVGDVCSAIHWSQSQMWQQMRLWTQAKQMGSYAAKCVLNHSLGKPVIMDFCFEIFNHVTCFFGFKVVLLGLFNAHGLKLNEYNVAIRCTKGVEFVKAVLKNGRLIGAILIGETGLEETFENLILNQLDISHIEEHFLDPDIDIEDYFD